MLGGVPASFSGKTSSLLGMVFTILAATVLQTTPLVDRSEVRAQYLLSPESKGFSLLCADVVPAMGDVAEPNVSGGFGVGFDLHNPRERDPFNANGNIYGRPEREVSLHWNGTEIANRLSPVEIRSDKAQETRIKVEWTIGGSLVSVWVGKTAIYDRFLVPKMRPLKSSWNLVGAQGDVKLSYGRGKKEEASQKVRVFDAEINDVNRHRFTKSVQLPEKVDRVGRLVGTLKLGPTPKGIDPWDRSASLSLKDQNGKRFEVLRCMTPYRKGWTWQLDLTHLLPLLQGKKELSWDCETWGEGWAVTFDLEYFEGRLAPKPVAVIPLWQNTYEIGTKKPLPASQSLDVPSFKRAQIYTTVSGHGMNPNTGNAAEFIKLWRKLSVNGTPFQSDLWKEDNYLNPCRPQGGTWKYDRAGWAPGSVLDPWVVDVTKQLKVKSVFEYEIQPYENKSPVEGNPARHIIESVLVLWR